MKYEHKPTIVEAFKWDAGRTKIPDWFNKAVKDGKVGFKRVSDDNLVANIMTGTGSAKCSVGDVIVNKDGDIYPMTEKTFVDVYQEIKPKTKVVKSGKVRNNDK